MQPVVELSQVRKIFGPVEALKGISLAVEPGQVVAFLGPNGAGKTTAISIMLGMRRPTAGQTRLFGMSPWDRRARSRVGVMLQESGVPQVLKVRELIDLFRSYYPDPLPTERLIALAGLEDKVDALAGRLSGGQARRLYFALALSGNPEVLFLDEPTVGMDVEGRHTFWAGIQEFIGQGKTIVLTTHYLEEADRVANRVVVVDQGLVIADATPAEIKANVAGRRVSFLADWDPAQALAGLPIKNLEFENGRIRFLTNEPERVLRDVFAKGLSVSDLEVVGADLEEAFLSLTAREAAHV